MESIKVFTLPMIERRMLNIRPNSLRKLDEKMDWPDGLEKKALEYSEKLAMSPRPTGGDK
jgi:hypothetical protein